MWTCGCHTGIFFFIIPSVYDLHWSHYYSEVIHIQNNLFFLNADFISGFVQVPSKNYLNIDFFVINWNAKCLSLSQAPFREKNLNRFQKLYLIVRSPGVPLVLASFLSYCEFLNGILSFATWTRDVSCTICRELQLLFLAWPRKIEKLKKPNLTSDLRNRLTPRNQSQGHL